ncbi:uncharacterized protein OCT59_002614 [Rhizophagus irregularis]|uniref:Uncharacterized protein n=1 Tax=Rhizophagus irregularis TaxID=588596 RepID=A0A915ZNS0_9GLOM|nr:hypothetical protein OCT59_002614 [Rhizophagus irregularis]CAB4492517.1 unnamed protein product [Rhizophagus irregularis]CAB5384910.1 unnamed protein product [Rhizophagus irregularis]
MVTGLVAWILYFRSALIFLLGFGSAYISFDLSFRLVCIGFDFDFGSVNFDITTLNWYVSALCFDAFKLSTLKFFFRYRFLSW